MDTEFGAKLKEAIAAKDNDINSLVWKDKTGVNIRLMDISQNELKRYHRHCEQMLTNRDIYKPGKLVIRENIQKCWDSCNAELFARYLMHDCETDIKTNKDLLDFINVQRKANNVDVEDSISVLFTGLPPIYEKVTVGKLMDVCFDKLDVLNKKMITDKFIIAQGIWLTDEEKQELTELETGDKIRNRMEVIKERLCLNPDIRLRVSPTGLSFAEFRALIQLSDLPKISSLSTIALKTLRDKVLLLLDNDLDYHINKWMKIKKDIERVAEYKNWNLD